MTEEEAIRLRSYLAAQSMRRTPEQILEALQEAHHQLIAALPDAAYSTASDARVWSVLEIVEHVYLFMLHYTTAICDVLENGKCPPDVRNRDEIIPCGDRANTRDNLLTALEKLFQRLTRSVLQVEPLAHLDITWRHFELGEMHWREWLLFARVHLLDHVQQVKQTQMPVDL